MNAILRDRIDALASDILSAIEESAPIADINSIVKKLGGRVEEVNEVFSIEGSIAREGEGFCITVPMWQNQERKNFTIAHELGHLFLHMGYLINDSIWQNSSTQVYYRQGNSASEQEANEFAASLLMPRELFKKIIEKNSENGRVNISRVADFFNVSVDAASYRGKWLGLLQW